MLTRHIASISAAAFCGLALSSTALAAGGVAPSFADEDVLSPTTPVITKVTCRGACDGIDRLRVGTLVRVRGRALARAREVIFLGSAGPDDDVAASAQRLRQRQIDVRVPSGARTGPLAVRLANGTVSAPSTAVVAFDTTVTDLAAAPGGPIAARASADTIFFAGERTASLDLLVRGDAAQDVTVTLARGADGAEVARWALGSVLPSAPRRVTWAGLPSGPLPTEGRYEFRVFSTTAAAPTGARAAQVTPAALVATDSFLFLGHSFPVQSETYTYGVGAGRFGALRGYGGHQGQDVFATCGTPLVAARGGTVRWKATHARAGNYLVIDGEDIERDYAYMHMRDAALVEKGDRVKTGQLIGYVGDTGRASGCHLHFELWDGKGGWQAGATPIDPLPLLRAWAVPQ